MYYITYTMASLDLPDIYALARGHGHIYQANPPGHGITILQIAISCVW